MIYVAASALMNVIASVLLKLATTRFLEPGRVFSNPRTILLLTAAVGAYGAAFVAYFLALTQVPISVAYVTITGATSVLIVIIGVLVFHDRIDALQLGSLTLVLAGLTGLHVKV
jgi:small multidrug resistance pump